MGWPQLFPGLVSTLCFLPPSSEFSIHYRPFQYSESLICGLFPAPAQNVRKRSGEIQLWSRNVATGSILSSTDSIGSRTKRRSFQELCSSMNPINAPVTQERNTRRVRSKSEARTPSRSPTPTLARDLLLIYEQGGNASLAAALESRRLSAPELNTLIASCGDLGNDGCDLAAGHPYPSENAKMFSMEA